MMGLFCAKLFIPSLCHAVSFRHSRAGGNPAKEELDSRLRGNDELMAVP
jgi:hypothetical protein